jgi:hypothetical protein
LQASDNSPLKKLEKLYNALQQSSGEFNFEQNLLNAPKALDSKVENSLQKVINCKWENYAEVSNKLGMRDLTRNINNMLQGSNDAAKEMEFGIEFLKEIDNSEPAHVLEKLENACEAVKSMYEVAKKEDKKLLSFFSSVLAFNLGLNTIDKNFELLARK